jgi:hypothetical protein
MPISTNQVSAVIRTYLKNARDKLENEESSHPDSEGVRDEVRVSDDAKKILYERISKRVAEKLRNKRP